MGRVEVQELNSFRKSGCGTFRFDPMPVYAFGSNEHHQVDRSAPLQVPGPFLLEDSSRVVAASWSQSITRTLSIFNLEANEELTMTIK